MIYRLGLSALAAEATAIGLLFLQDSSALLIVTFLGLHGLGSALTALVVRLVLPESYREPRRWILAYLFAFNLLMPLAGLFCAITAIVLATVFPARRRETPFGVVPPPRFTTHRNQEGTGFRGGQVRAQLNNGRAPLDQRLKALVAVQETPARTTADLLRNLLSDSAEDLRLLAYGILDGKEKHITERILDNKTRLDTAARAEERSRLHETVAELYWELIYQNLVQGDMRLFSVEQVRLHLNAALEESANPSARTGLWFLLARLELSQNRIDGARYALQRAEAGGFVRERLLPYLAELCFLEKRYADVSRLLAELGDRPGLPVVVPVVRYWTGQNRAIASFDKGNAGDGTAGSPSFLPSRRRA